MSVAGETTNLRWRVRNGEMQLGGAERTIAAGRARASGAPTHLVCAEYGLSTSTVNDAHRLVRDGADLADRVVTGELTFRKAMECLRANALLNARDTVERRWRILAAGWFRENNAATVETVGRRFKLPPSTVFHASRLVAHGDWELIDAFLAGRMPLTAASNRVREMQLERRAA